MLVEEAEWIGAQLEKLIRSGSIKSVLNVGSSTSDSWNEFQPHVEKFVFNKLKNQNIVLLNTDIKEGSGVDLAGDLNDEPFIIKLSEMNFSLVICANLLEHVKDPARIAAHISKLLNNGSYAIITVPHIYPYHPDPDDYLFRPGIENLKSLFPALKLVSAAIVRGSRTLRKQSEIKICSNYIQVLLNDPRLFALTFLRLLTPFYKYKNWKKTAFYLPFFFKPFSVTCLVLVKNGNNE